MKNSPYNADDFQNAIGRYVRWQWHKRFHRTRLIVPFVNQINLILHKDYYSTTGQYYEGLTEWIPMLFLLKYCGETDVFVDLGANAGVYTLLAAGIGGAYTYAIEADREAFEFLENQVQVNDLQNRVTMLNTAVGASAGQVNFSIGLGQRNHVMGEGDNSNATLVDMSTLDEILGDQFPTILKLDLEGYELRALQGATSLLQRDSLQVIIAEEMQLGHRYQDSSLTIFNLLCDYGYYLVKYDQKSNSCDLTTDISDMNIFVRDLSKVNSRLKENSKLIRLQNRKIV